jgi:hypothetical protein
MRIKIGMLIIMMLFCVVGKSQRMMFFDGISNEHMYYDEANDELVSLSKVEAEFTFSLFDDFSGFFSLDSNGNFKSYGIKDYNFDEESGVLTLYLMDEAGMEPVVIINETSMLLVISYDANDRVELNRYEMASIRFDSDAQ